ncbi:MAG: hypothetical protein V3T89_01145 [bacterium]
MVGFIIAAKEYVTLDKFKEEKKIGQSPADCPDVIYISLHISTSQSGKSKAKIRYFLIDNRFFYSLI